MKKGFTVIELMVGLLIMSLVLTGLYITFSSSQKNAQEIMANQQINDQFERVLHKITEDVREANEISKDFPPTVDKADLAGLKTESAGNKLNFVKITYDFTKDPLDLPPGTFNYTKTEISYFLLQENEAVADSPWVLIREMTPYDNRMQKLVSEIRAYPVLEGIDECIFYRLNDPDASRSGNLYIKLRMTRLDKEGSIDQKYGNQTTITVKERGALPQ